MELRPVGGRVVFGGGRLGGSDEVWVGVADCDVNLSSVLRDIQIEPGRMQSGIC